MVEVGVRVLARMAGLSVARAAAAMDELEAAGLVLIARAGPNRARARNCYGVLQPAAAPEPGRQASARRDERSPGRALARADTERSAERARALGGASAERSAGRAPFLYKQEADPPDHAAEPVPPARPQPAIAAEREGEGEGEGEGVLKVLRSAGVSAPMAAELAREPSLTRGLVERVAAEVRRRGAGPGALVAELRDPATLAVHVAELRREREQRAAREAAAAARQRAAPPARPADEAQRAAAALLARLTPESVARVKRAVAQRAPALAEQIARPDWQPGPLTAADVVELVEDELIAEAHAVAAANGITWPHSAAAG